MYKLNLGNDLYLKGRIGWKGLNKNEYLENGDYRIINATSLQDKLINWDICGYITQERYDESPEIQLEENDILISKDGTLGKIGYVKKLDKPSTVASGVFVLRNTCKDKVNTDYLYHILKSSIFKDFITKRKASGSTINHLYQRDLVQFEIDLPSLDIQEKVANLLSSFDSKIELNNKISNELEAMAKTLYDYWFVQFDFPDENGKPYRSSGGAMEYCAELKREIPRGWEVKKLDDVIAKTGTGLNPRDNFKLGFGNNYYVTIKNIEQGKVILDDKCDKVDDEALAIINKRSDLKIGDILFTSIQPVGVTYLIQEEPKNWNINESVFTVRPNNDFVSSDFLFMLLSSDFMKAYTNNVSAGSIHKGVRHTDLKAFKFAYLNNEIIKQFDIKIKPILKKMYINQQQNQELAKLRDWLLPMLMNGQVSVK